MKVAILYDVLDRDGCNIRLGGIQTYVCHLAKVCLDAGWEVMVFQPASRNFEVLMGPIRICGVYVSTTPRNGRDSALAVLPSIRNWAETEQLIVVFGQIDMAIPVSGARTIGIQHGIYWDLNSDKPKTPWPSVSQSPAQPQSNIIRRVASGWLRKSLVGQWRNDAHTYRRLKAYATGYSEVDVRVCVDHNFVNWHRTIFNAQSSNPEYVIINPAEAATSEQLSDRNTDREVTRIIFARRFFWYRGTGIMALASKRLLAAHSSISITFAGEGPDSASLMQYFSGESRVQFIAYHPEESLKIHLAHDVAVNASLGSEGSCLSVGEAMGAGCAVVATNVGGVTNMIMDGYNGILVNPNDDALYQGLERLVANADLRSSLGKRAWQTASAAFSLDNWGRQWRDIIVSAASKV